MKRRQHLGKLIEIELIETWKLAGIYENSSIKLYDPVLNISGELDCIIKNPSGELIVVEAKSYYGYWAAKEIEGSKYTKSKPKDQNLLQTLLYLHYFKDIVAGAKIYYVARDKGHEACFNVGMRLVGDRHYAVIGAEGETMELHPEIYVEGILDRYRILNRFIEANVPPGREFKLRWNDAEMEDMGQSGELSKTDYAAWKKAKVDSNRQGDFQCSYCAYKKTCYDPVWNQAGFDWGTYEGDPIYNDPTEVIADTIAEANTGAPAPGPGTP
jgi:PD-(D/E)XK nuclease superfamily